MNKGIKALIVGIAALFAAGAHAIVVDFEDAANSGTCGPILMFSTSQGFVFTSVHHHICNSTATNFVSNGTDYLTSDMGDVVTMTAATGDAFDLTQLDLAEIYVGNNAETNASSVQLTGTLTGGGTVAQTFTLDGIADGPGGAADFQTFAVIGFSDVISVTFDGQGTLASQFAFATDNLLVNGEIPEPASLALVALGLLALAYRRRTFLAGAEAPRLALRRA